MSEPRGFAIRPATDADDAGLWRILEPVIRAGETYTLPRDMGRAEALAYWRSPAHAVFAAEATQEPREILGTYYLRANQMGPGAHIANCGYMTAPWAAGRGIAMALCRHSLDEARRRGFRAMQFNCVVSTNERAVRLWRTAALKSPAGCRAPSIIRAWATSRRSSCIARWINAARWTNAAQT